MKHLEYLPSVKGFKIIYIPNAEDLSLPFIVSTIGLTGEEGIITRNPAAKYFIIYSAEGCGKAFVNNEWHLMPKGSLLFIPRGESVSYEPASDTPWSTYYITFNGSAVKSFLNIPTHIINDATFSFLPEFFAKAKETFEDDNFFAFVQGGLLYTLQLLRNCTLNTFDRKSTRPDSSDTQSRISESIRYFTENFNQDIPVSTLAEKCGISVQYYCKFFKEQTGSAPTGYIKTVRIVRACEMLKNEPELKNYEIAERCGFASVTYFNKVFKDIMKVTPSEYRNNLIAKN